MKGKDDYLIKRNNYNNDLGPKLDIREDIPIS